MIRNLSTNLRFKKTAAKILSEIKKAKKILLALHVSPDGDSLASVMALNLVLKRMKKETQIISFSRIPSRLLDWLGDEKIENLDFAWVDFNNFDLFVALDSADKKMITRSPFPEKFPPGFKIINIDHHFTNTKYGKINLVGQCSSTTELLYHLFAQWQVKIDQKLANFLFWGIMTDTGCFQYPNASADTFLAAAELIKKGASLDKAVLLNFRSYGLKTLKYWGKVLENIELDKSGKFVCSTVSREEKESLGVDPSEIEGAASLFAPVIVGTEFGIILNEESKNLTRGSLRSRADFDVSQIAQELGGGGHKQAAGFSLALPLEKAKEKVLEIARKSISLPISGKK